MAFSYDLFSSAWATVTSISLVLIIITILLKTKRKSAADMLNNVPPGNLGWPIVGESLQLLRAMKEGSLERFVKDRMVKYKSDKVFKTSLLGEPMAVLTGAAGNRFLFTNENKLLTVWWPSSVRRLLGTSIATTAGTHGIQMRKMVSYFVSPDAFTKLYIHTIHTVTHHHIISHWQGKEELEVYPAIKSYSFELACRLFMSIEGAEQIKRLGGLFNVFVAGVASMDVDFPGTQFYKAKRATNAIKKEILAIVRKRRQDLMERQDTAVPDLLSHLLTTPDHSGNFMSESVIVNNVLLLLFGGRDTTSSAITMLIRTLAQHPQVYHKVLTEHSEIASSKQDGEALEWEDIKKMRYSWNVVCETMRLYPPAAIGFREALLDINYQGYHIPKGWKLFWNAASTHTDSSLFADNAKFDPSRFDGSGPVPYSYVPFGGGPRMCMGKEFARLQILTFLHQVVRKFRWDLVIPGEKIVNIPHPTPEHGLPIRLQPHLSI